MLEVTGNLPVKNDELPVTTPKIRAKDTVSHQLTTNVTERELKLYSSLSESLYTQALIKEPSMYHFLKYAVKLFTEFVLATAQRAQEKAKELQNARRSE